MYPVSKLIAQEKQDRPEKFMPTELNISSSAVFELMGVTPSQISRSSDVKDFKVDWSFKSWKLNPNIALQGQPVWELFYSRRSLEKYRQASWLGRTLASMEVSVGTVQNEKGDRRIGFGGKLNLFKSNEPIRKQGFFDDIIQRYSDELKSNSEQLKSVKAQMDTVKDIALYRTLSTQLITLENGRNDIFSQQKEEVVNQSAAFSELYWNTSYVDIGGGDVYTYQTDSLGSLKKLSLNRNTGYSGWITAGIGIGKKWLISGMARTLIYDERISFTTRDTITQQEFPRDTVIGNNLLTCGINIRYGSPFFNVFLEFFTDQRKTKDKLTVIGAGKEDVAKLPANQVVINKTVSWNVQPVYSITLGGDWRMNRSVMLNFGMRMEFDSKWNKQTFTPITTLLCLMR